MRKFKKAPKKLGWYVAWFDGVELNFRTNINDTGNIFYWDGYCWLNHHGHTSRFLDEGYKDDRWSHLPKGHALRDKPSPVEL